MTRVFFFCVSLLCAPVRGQGPLPARESPLVRTLRGTPEIIYSVAFSPDGKDIASGGADNILSIRRVEDGSSVKKLVGHRNFINSVVFSPDGTKLASASGDSTIKIWDLATASCLRTFRGHGLSVPSAVFFPGGERVASGGRDGTLRLWQLAAGKPYKTIRTRSGVYSLAVSSEGTRLASGEARNITIWDAGSGLRRLILEGHSGPVNSVSFSTITNHLASGSEDGTVKIWRLSDGICLKTFSGRQQLLYGGSYPSEALSAQGRNFFRPRPVLAVSYSADGNYVFSGGEDNIISVWRVSDLTPAGAYAGHAGQVKSLDVSRDGKYLASGSSDHTVKLWLTPMEAERRDREVKEKERTEAEKNRNYDLHYAAGLKGLSSPTKKNLEKAETEFAQALSFKPTKACEEKLKEASDALRLKKAQIDRLMKLVLKGLLALFALLLIIRFVAGARRKARLRRTLPGEIRNETLSGSYENAMRLYTEYKSLGGDPRNLPQAEMLDLYRRLNALYELPKENLPYHYLLSYAVAIAKDANYKLALALLRSGKLLDEFKTPAEFDIFVGIYGKTARPEKPLMLKLGAGAYSNLAEAFFKAGDHESCENICSLKKQFYAAKFSPRDAELLSACRKAAQESRPAAKLSLRWRCINCGYVHEEPTAPDACPACSHPKDHFEPFKDS